MLEVWILKRTTNSAMPVQFANLFHSSIHDCVTYSLSLLSFWEFFSYQSWQRKLFQNFMYRLFKA